MAHLQVLTTNLQSKIYHRQDSSTTPSCNFPKNILEITLNGVHSAELTIYKFSKSLFSCNLEKITL